MGTRISVSVAVVSCICRQKKLAGTVIPELRQRHLGYQDAGCDVQRHGQQEQQVDQSDEPIASASAWSGRSTGFPTAAGRSG
jgi:hypothetical protein